MRSKYRGVPVTRHTELVIEGYQRSGNNFAVIAFQQAQNRPVNIAHNLHAPAQIIRASQFGIPSILLIRHPTDVSISQVIRSPHISIEHSLKSYISYYEKIFPFRNTYEVGIFDEVISDFSILIKRINRRFNKCYDLFVHSSKNTKYIFSIIDQLNQRREGELTKLSRPSIEKQKKKEELLYAFKCDKIKKIVDYAETVFQKYCDLSKEQKGIEE